MAPDQNQDFRGHRQYNCRHAQAYFICRCRHLSATHRRQQASSYQVQPYMGPSPPTSITGRQRFWKEREEWFETSHSPSTIPHMHFGKVDKLFNVIIMFPRMNHKNPLTGQSATLIPWEIQNQKKRYLMVLGKGSKPNSSRTLIILMWMMKTMHMKTLPS